MEKKFKQYNINDLYKVLRKHDVEILKHYNDDTISDEDYFFYGINSDIISNSLNVIINYLSGNIESAGVDLSCRSIIEAMVILKMDACGAINNNQKKIYRYSYAYVDYDNFHALVKDLPEFFKNDNFSRIKEDKEKAKQIMLKHFMCTEKDLKDRKISIDDPCFYLKSNLFDDIRFIKLIEKYPIGDGSEINAYTFFSLLIHPRCELNYNVQTEIMKFRQLYIDQVLDYVFQFLKSCNLLGYDENALDYDYEFFYNPLLKNNVHNIKEMEKLIQIIKNQICYLPNGVDDFTYCFLERVRYLVIDMMISLSLGYKEHVIACFKPFVEEYSIFFAIGSVESQEDFVWIKKGYWISSRIQFDDFFNKLGIRETSTPEEEIRELFEQYYKEKYNIEDYQNFYSELRKNSLFFLLREKKSFNKHVRKLIEEVFFDNKMESKDVMTIYRISKDMSHASGYNFNATSAMVDVTAQKVLLYTYKFILHFVLYSSITLKEHNVENEVTNIVEFLQLLIAMHNDAIEKIYKEYSDCNSKNN